MVELRKVRIVGSVEECMSVEEKELCKTLKKALLSPWNASRANLKFNFDYTDSTVLLSMVKQSCMGCYECDIGYVERCHHDCFDKYPCSLWEFRGGRVHDNTIPLSSRYHYFAEGTYNDEERIKEIFIYLPKLVDNELKHLKFRWEPRIKKSVTISSAQHLVRCFVGNVCWNNTLLNRWECLGYE